MGTTTRSPLSPQGDAALLPSGGLTHREHAYAWLGAAFCFAAVGLGVATSGGGNSGLAYGFTLACLVSFIAFGRVWDRQDAPGTTAMRDSRIGATTLAYAFVAVVVTVVMLFKTVLAFVRVMS